MGGSAGLGWRSPARLTVLSHTDVALGATHSVPQSTQLQRGDAAPAHSSAAQSQEWEESSRAGLLIAVMQNRAEGARLLGVTTN